MGGFGDVCKVAGAALGGCIGGTAGAEAGAAIGGAVGSTVDGGNSSQKTAQAQQSQELGNALNGSSAQKTVYVKVPEESVAAVAQAVENSKKSQVIDLTA